MKLGCTCPSINKSFNDDDDDDDDDDDESFVAGEGFLSRQVSRVEFIPTTAKPQPTMPPDISRDEFFDMNDVLTTCMPRSQLGTVISSYEKTIGK